VSWSQLFETRQVCYTILLESWWHNWISFPLTPFWVLGKERSYTALNLVSRVTVGQVMILARNSCTKQGEQVHCHGGETDPPPMLCPWPPSQGPGTPACRPNAAKLQTLNWLVISTASSYIASGQTLQKTVTLLCVMCSIVVSLSTWCWLDCRKHCPHGSPIVAWHHSCRRDAPATPLPSKGHVCRVVPKQQPSLLASQFWLPADMPQYITELSHMLKPYSKQEMTQQTLLYLHLSAEVCASRSSVISWSVQK
jgi:hypothetical protein